ncbi:hypothetical protein [Amphritea sp.]|uniref:hypothetical protein n=1 Tax=Amphritea sp. TaxID=1872502 RepID=UPI003D0F79C3
MEFGTSFYQVYNDASESAKAAFDEIAGVVDDISEQLVTTAEDAGEKLLDAANYAADKTLNAANYAVDKTVDAAKYAADKAIDAAEYARDKSIAAGRYVKQTAIKTADAVQQKVVQAKDSVESYLGPQPAGSKIVFCPNRTKAERVRYRQNKIDQSNAKLANMPEGPAKDALEKATERFEFNNVAVERARLADSAYSIGQDPPPEGWIRPSREEIQALGLNLDDFPQYKPDFVPSEHKDGYFAELYKTDPSVYGEERYVLAYRGTQGATDWETNAKQGFGEETEHYDNAIKLAIKSKKILGDKLELTGHSLGGGMATAAGIVSGAKTYAYNPAGVHPATLERKGDFSRSGAFNTVNGKPLVDNVVVPGELLTALQNPTVQRTTLAGGVGASTAISPYAGALVASGATSTRAFQEEGVISYGMAGKRHDVPLLGNAAEVADATSKGQSIQGMTPSKAGDINAALNPVKKVDMHSMHSVIAGIEQQKADDLGQIERNT